MPGTEIAPLPDASHCVPFASANLRNNAVRPDNTVRQKKMSLPEEMMHEVGTFDPLDAKKILAAFEAAGTRFEIESDHSELTRPGRTIQLALGMSPAGSKLRIFVPESFLSNAQAIIAELYPL